MKMITIKGVEITDSILPIEAKQWAMNEELKGMDLTWPGRAKAVAELEELEGQELELSPEGPYSDESVAVFLVRARLEYGSDSHYTTVESGPDENAEIVLHLSLEDYPKETKP